MLRHTYTHTWTNRLKTKRQNQVRFDEKADRGRRTPMECASETVRWKRMKWKKITLTLYNTSKIKCLFLRRKYTQPSKNLSSFAFICYTYFFLSFRLQNHCTSVSCFRSICEKRVSTHQQQKWSNCIVFQCLVHYFYNENMLFSTRK